MAHTCVNDPEMFRQECEKAEAEPVGSPGMCEECGEQLDRRRPAGYCPECERRQTEERAETFSFVPGTLLTILLLCLSAASQTGTTGAGSWIGGMIGQASQGAGAPDIALPNFTSMGGAPLMLPQAGVNPLAPFNQTIANTVYIGPSANGCPANTAGAGACTYYGATVTPWQNTINAWCAAGDARWDVIFVPTTYNFGTSTWTWCDKYQATQFIVFHSSSPNPRGRQVCSHGSMDQVSPAVPNMGYRNHGCTGATLGFPPVTAAVPLQPSAYPYSDTTDYNDAANMAIITGTASGATGNGTGGSLIAMGAANTGTPDSCGSGTGGSGTSPCPNDGVNHIVVQDIFFSQQPPSPSNLGIYPITIYPAEWMGQHQLNTTWLPASPHDIGFDEDYFGSDADDDGFGLEMIAAYVKFACQNCWFNHNYIDTNKRDGSEGHGIELSDNFGPAQVVDDWMEGNSIAFWGGGGGVPAIANALTTNIEVARNHVTYNPRWAPSPAGIQVDSNTILSLTCSGTTLVLALKGSILSSTGNIYDPVIYVNGVTNVTPQWYTATLSNSSGNTATLTVPSCTSVALGSSPKIYGFEGTVGNGQPLTVTSAAALNACTYGSQTALCNPTHMNPVAKNRMEWKEGQSFWVDGNIVENSVADGQSGQCLDSTVRACSGVSKCTGAQNQGIYDLVLTNNVVRGCNEGFLLSARSGNGSYGCWSDTGTSPCSSSVKLNNVTCDSTGTIANFNYNGNPSIQNSGTSTGTDVYLYNAGSSLLPNGWYNTSNINYAATIPVILPTSTTCTPSSTITTTGTLYAVDNGDGNGVTPGSHRLVFQNNLVYDIGDHTTWNGSGSVMSVFHGSSGNNFSVNITMGGPSTPTVCDPAGGHLSIGEACAVATAINTCPAAGDCPDVIQANPYDLAYVQCLTTGQAGFSSGAQGTLGVPMQTVDPNQTWFTYYPNYGTVPSAGMTATCPLATPLQAASGPDSGYYNGQSYPKTTYYNHNTIVGENGSYITGAAFESYLNFRNGFLVIPGTNDVAPTNTASNPREGFAFDNSDSYTGPSSTSCPGGTNTDATGLTKGGDPATLAFSNMAIADRSLVNYPMFGGSGAAPVCTDGGSGDGAYAAGSNSTPMSAACSGNTVTCNGGHACSATYYTPDCIGFSGALGTNNYPLTLSDWRNYGLSPSSSSPYKSGGLFQANDGLDNGAQIPIIVTAMSRTLRPCLLNCGSGYYHDGPQYGWLTWTATSGATSYRIYRDGATSPTATTTNTYYQDYGMAINSSHTWVVNSWNGSVETPVSGLATQMY